MIEATSRDSKNFTLGCICDEEIAGLTGLRRGSSRVSDTRCQGEFSFALPLGSSLKFCQTFRGQIRWQEGGHISRCDSSVDSWGFRGEVRRPTLSRTMRLGNIGSVRSLCAFITFYPYNRRPPGNTNPSRQRGIARSGVLAQTQVLAAASG